MKILLCTRGDYDKRIGSDSVIVKKITEHLRKLGVVVDINNGGITDYSEYDIVHLFNLYSIGEIYHHYKLAHRHNKNIVITPIYWNLEKYYTLNEEMENLKLWTRANVYRKLILKGCKRVYLSSGMELDMLQKDFGKDICCSIVPIGVEVESEDIPLYNLKERYNLENYILCVGRISPRKNQLSLIKACSHLGIPLVLIGYVKNQKYFNACKAEGKMLYLGTMDSYGVYNAYRFAKVHALPSFLETPGIASLEASVCGCNIVTTQEGSAREYFKDMAFYCNPYSSESIEEAVYKAWKKPKNEELKQYVRKTYQWEQSARTLIEDYEKMMCEEL